LVILSPAELNLLRSIFSVCFLVTIAIIANAYYLQLL